MGLPRYALSLAAFLCLLAGCGGQKQPTSNFPPPPTSADPWFGTAGNVLVSDRNSDKDGTMDLMWIGFNSATEWQKFQSEMQKFPQGGFSIGGVVVPSSRTGVHFYFDPNTTTTAEAGIPEIFTVLDTLKVDPTVTNAFSPDWFIPAAIEQVK